MTSSSAVPQRNTIILSPDVYNKWKTALYVTRVTLPTQQARSGGSPQLQLKDPFSP